VKQRVLHQQQTMMKFSFLPAFVLALSGSLVVQLVAGDSKLRATVNQEDSAVADDTGAGARRRLLPLQHIGNNGEPSSVFPLGECQGDCDSDLECQPGLVCFIREDDTPIPGCDSENDHTLIADFCYNPNPEITTPSPTTLPPTSQPTPPPTPLPTPLPTPPPTPLPTALTPQPTPPPTPLPTALLGLALAEPSLVVQ